MTAFWKTLVFVPAVAAIAGLFWLSQRIPFADAQLPPLTKVEESPPILDLAQTVSADLTSREEPPSFSSSESESRLRADVSVLASDEFEGRGIGTDGIEQAANYIAEEFRQAGLTTDWGNNGPFQEFSLMPAFSRIASGAPEITISTHETATDSSRSQPLKLKAGTDFTFLLRSDRVPEKCRVVFGGYGITAPEWNYDDYQNVDLTNSAVVIIRGEPQFYATRQQSDAGHPSRHASVYAKIENAIAHGASVIIVVDSNSQEHSSTSVRTTPSGLLDVEFSQNLFSSAIPVVHCHQEVLSQFFTNADLPPIHELEELIRQTSVPQSRSMNTIEVDLGWEKSKHRHLVKNVIGSVEPHDSESGQTIVIGAHYDHLGRDGWGSLSLGADGEIHNGADDNASGTSVLLEVARRLSKHRDQLVHRVLIIAFTAEEVGLRGSQYYVREPVVPLNETMAMINLDMVGRLREKVTVYGVGTAIEWNELVSEGVTASSLTAEFINSGYGPSDHAVFHEAGIPVLHFFTGFHPQYHRPEDDTEWLNISGMLQIADCVTNIVLEIGSGRRTLTRSNDSQTNLWSDLIAGGLNTDSQRRHRGLGVRVQATADSPGVRVLQVLPESVAEQAGLKPHDRLLKLNSTTVNSPSELQTLLETLNLEEQATLEVQRRSLILEFKVNF
ncbi:Aminopeptidase YwaD precursor [Thalassoglobus neptunius]|uniref:Aminopeptidase YwaD n=1 Tax=Thalassoglobus neptunius TaxID=1938619 RepID=A0A5C5WNC3_9PLAN|nr:M28 family peptidase [Thalassoglobus neptunius]TWT51513.1 Aminopeptidase YwaD precursor [Thalassoglobus neptunius]